MIRLIVKGDRETAVKAASDRGIPFEFRNEIKPKDLYPEFTTVGLTSECYLEKVSKWFVEDISHASPWGNGQGYPVGSLLHYASEELSDRVNRERRLVSVEKID